MIRTARQHTYDCAVAKSLADALGFLVPVEALRDCVAVKLSHLAITLAEIDEAIRYAEKQDRIVGLTTERGVKYKLTEAGELWVLENHV